MALKPDTVFMPVNHWEYAIRDLATGRITHQGMQQEWAERFMQLAGFTVHYEVIKRPVGEWERAQPANTAPPVQSAESEGLPDTGA